MTIESWTFTDVLAHMQRDGSIPTPLTDAERDLARRVAEAHYYTMALTEMPAAGPWEEVGFSYIMGICRVIRQRDEGE
jgi:hypothetical protein